MVHRSPVVAGLVLLASACAQPAATTGDQRHDDLVAAQEVPTLATLQKGQGPRRLALPVAASPEENAALAARNARLQQFLQGEGRGWRVVFDRRSGQPSFLEGPGVPFIPGPGNTLRHRDPAAGLREASPAEHAARMAERTETEARELLGRHEGLLGFTADELQLDESWTGSPDGSDDLYLTTFRHAPRGFSQHDARLTFVIKQGNLIQIHAERVQPARAGLTATVSEDEAFLVLERAAGLNVTPRSFQSELKLVQLATTAEAPGHYGGPIGSGYEQRLAWMFRFQLPGDHKTIAAWVDAQNGELIELFDDNKYGSVIGGVLPRSPGDGERELPFGHVAVEAGGGKQTADLGGRFDYTNGIASTALAGSFMNVSDKCAAPAASVSGGTGQIHLGTSGGADCNFSSLGRSTRAARTAYFHLNAVRQMGKKWLGGVNAKATSWIGNNVGVNVNINDKCNAYWDGSTVNFFRSGSGCNNTGEIADVMMHEWGHGIDQNTKSGSVGDAAKGEAISDIIALLLTRDHCVGPGFFQTSGGETPACKTAVRDLAHVVTTSTLSSKCTKSQQCKGANGYQCHCESHLLSGALWELSKKFVSRYGEHDGWARYEKAFLRALPNMTAYMPQTAGNAYSALLAANDDDGNVNNGTPDADLVFDAFQPFGLAGTQVPKLAVNCTDLSSVGDVKATGQVNGVVVEWATGKGETYDILRNLDGSGTNAFLPLAEKVAGNTYTDAQVVPGFKYRYIVVANAGSCTTPYGMPSASAAALEAGAGAGADDFSVMVQPAVPSVAPGGTATVRITTAVTSGVAQAVTLSVIGLPANVTGSFNPATVNAGAASTLTLTAASNATNGTTNITIRGAGPKASHDISARVVVAPAATGGGSKCPPGTIDVAGVCIPKGCSAAGASPGWLALLGIGALLLRRRRAK